MLYGSFQNAATPDCRPSGSPRPEVLVGLGIEGATLFLDIGRSLKTDTSRTG